MIIQTGMRTDIPAYYSEWFINRLKEGFVYTRNPFNPKQITKYLLNHDVVDMICFCTKNPAPMLKYIDYLKQYPMYWYVSITAFGHEIEENTPSKDKVIEDFKKLSSMIGVDCIGWRYDPIFLSDDYPIERHIKAFEYIASRLCGYTKTCVISFIDLYEKTKKNFPGIREVNFQDRITLGKEIIKIAKKYGIEVRPCGEGDELEKYGANCDGCMTIDVYEKAMKAHLKVPSSQKVYLREGCKCILGRDIGEYNTCAHFCKYCYANYDNKLVLDNMKKHDPKSPLLIGNVNQDDVIHQAEQTKWEDVQISLFDDF